MDKQASPQWAVSLEKHGATWYYFTHNPHGGGFGSNYCGPQYVALAKATYCIPAGERFSLKVNDKHRGVQTKAVQS